MVYTNTPISQKADITVEIEGTRNGEASRIVVTKEFDAGRYWLFTDKENKGCEERSILV